MEAIYENFYEIHAYALTAGVIYVIYSPFASYYLRNKRNPHRAKNQSPFWLRIKSKLNKTKLGKFNLKTHIMWEKLRNRYTPSLYFYLFAKLRVHWYFKAIISCALGGLLGLTFAESHKAFHTDGIRWYTVQTPYLFQDRVFGYLSAAKNPMYANHLLDWELKNRIYSEKNDMLDYIQYGKLMSSALQEEIAFHCYYMAYLKDHENLKTNADSDFDTFIINKS